MQDDALLELRGGTALVTGASSGLGEHFAAFLARNQINLVLTARRHDLLERNAELLRERHGVHVTVLPADLTQPEERRHLFEQLVRGDQHIDVLVNNAGSGTLASFAHIPEERVISEVELNCVATTHLAHLCLPGMLDRGKGLVINVASIAAYQPIPTMAVYAATKAYVLSFSQALWDETRTSGVRVIGVCPGPTETQFFINAGAPSSMPNRRSPEQVVQSTFRALNGSRHSVIDGGGNATMARTAKIAPTRLVLAVAKRFARPRRG